jgi:hypothetical protein
MPQSFFLTLADWEPAPHIIVLVVFLTAAVFAGFGFSLYPDSRLSPRRPIFWVWLIVACVGIGAALSAGDSIKEAFEQGPRDAAAIAQDQARLQSLFPGAMAMSSRSRSMTSISQETCSDRGQSQTPRQSRPTRQCGPSSISCPH